VAELIMQERAKRTRYRILEVAIDVFAEKGLHGARIDDIAEKAGVNKQRIYAYYNSKEGLCKSVIEEVYQLIVDYEEHLLKIAEEDIPKLTEIILRHYFKFHNKHPQFWRILSWMNLEGNSELMNVICDIKSDTLDYLRVLYAKGQQQDTFKTDVSFESYMLAVTSLSFFYFSNQRSMSEVLQINLRNKNQQSTYLDEVLRMFP
jgi:AcrR family transcriptional regulator